MVSVYPTMATSSLNFSLSDNNSEFFWAVIINQSGDIVKKQQFQAVNGITKYALATDNLPAGYYFLQIFNEKDKSKITKFIKQ